MKFTLPKTSILVSLLLLLLKMTCVFSNEAKPTTAVHLCGDQFQTAWDICCGQRCNVGNKRTLGVTISAEKASDFLERAWKRAHIRIQRTFTNAMEECCNEGCTIEEVSEYKC